MVRGTYLYKGNVRHSIAWKGIPYAQANRFEPSTRARRWNSPLDATNFGPSCQQDVKESYYGSVYWNKLQSMSENCLNLNIYKPISSSRDLPVTVWIHGGDFQYGSSALNTFDLSEFAAATKTIAVSFNYRLDIFGFLKTGFIVKGNLGLLDQQRAIKWVSKNIHRFGGDPNRITLAGEGAGGMSVSFHLLSPKSSKYFQQAIILNGDPINKWHFDSAQEALEKSKHFAEILECPDEFEESYVTCLKGKSVKNIMDVVPETLVDTFDRIPFAPTVDSEFFSDNPRKLLTKAKHLNGVRVIVGMNGNAGSLASREFLPMSDKNTMDEDTFRFSVEMALTPFSEELQEKAIDFYIENDQKGTDNFVKTFNNLAGDLKYGCSSQEFVDILHAKGAEVQKLFFNHRSQYSKWPQWAGVVQQDELMYILGEPFRQNPVINFTERERQLSKTLMAMFGKFVKEEPMKKWPKYAKNKVALRVQDGELKTIANHFYRKKFCDFWKANEN
ncbi:acetylcholinesterase-like [Culicoides brevitarsis]|uniref:acetylcholinesterase-like n=1 Tax=Culicoides brevitarsis TaxID=469753 RepID=UPI00307BE9CE